MKTSLLNMGECALALSQDLKSRKPDWWCKLPDAEKAIVDINLPYRLKIIRDHAQDKEWISALSKKIVDWEIGYEQSNLEQTPLLEEAIAELLSSSEPFPTSDHQKITRLFELSKWIGFTCNNLEARLSEEIKAITGELRYLLS